MILACLAKNRELMSVCKRELVGWMKVGGMAGGYYAMFVKVDACTCGH